MALPSSLTLQKLHNLGTSLPDYGGQLCDVLFGEEYIRCVSNLEENDLDWLINYLDKAFACLKSPGPAARKCLFELNSICVATSRLPTSCALPLQLLDADPLPIDFGAFGDVYHGTLNGSSVCIKRLRAYREDPRPTARLFCREVVTWKYLKHPNIVPFLGVNATSFQLISIWMPRGTLPDYIKEHPSADRIGLLSDVADGLCYLHSLNVVHMGIKGPNILVDDSGHARITDFGEAVVTKDEGFLEDYSEIAVTPRWAAPEVLEGRRWNKKSDIFSFAMVMIEAFTGAIPFNKHIAATAMAFILQGERPARPTHPTFTENLWELVQRCWAHDPDPRPDASEVLQILLAPAEPQAWKQSISDTLSRQERVSLITSIFSDRNEIEAVELLSGNDAQAFIDVVDEVLGHLPQHIYWRCFRYSYRICGRQSLLPKSFTIPICYDPTETPQCHGGFADVWKGQYCGRGVAAKALRISLRSDLSRVRRRFCKEVMTWNTLRHPNVLPLIGVTMTDWRFVMVSEWMENGNINIFVKTNTNANRLDLLGDVTRGLMYIHGQGIVHGDLKGANILIKNDGRACIADFSLLTILADKQTLVSTCTGSGTTPWMSPELLDPTSFGLQKCRLTKESDLYALGMVIYEVLSGLVPFEPIKVPVLNILRGERPKRPRDEKGAWFTDNIWGMLELCWKPQPGDRAGPDAVLRCLEGETVLWNFTGTGVEVDTCGQSAVTTASGSGLSITCRTTVPESSLVPQVSCNVPQDGGRLIDPLQTSDQKKGTIFRKLMESARKLFGVVERKSNEP